MFRSRFLKVSLALATLVGLVTAFSGVVATGASASGSPITLAYITSLTGLGASQDGGSQAGFLARIDAAERRWAASTGTSWCRW